MSAARIAKLEALLVGAGALALLLWRIDGTLPLDNDPLYADVVREMLRGGRWLDPQIHGVPFLDKPPLFYWLCAGVSVIAGVSEQALRAVAALLGAVGVAAVFGFVRFAVQRRAPALMAALLLLGSAQYAEYARRVTMEVPVAVLVFASLACYLRGAPLAGGLLVGLAFMTKSVVGVLGLAGYAASLLLARDWAALRSRRLWASLALAVLVAAPWHVYAWLRQPEIFLDFTWRLHVRDQVLDAQPWSAGGPLFYAIELVRVDPTFAVLALAALAGAIVGPLRRDRTARALAVSVVLQILLYSAAATKKPFYLLTAYPPAAALLGMVAAPLLARARGLALLPLAMLPLRLRAPPPDLAHFQRPLAEAFARLAPAGTPLHCVDTYFSVAQYYAGRRAACVIANESVARTLRRIPYLRYGDIVKAWPPAELRRRLRDESFWALVPTTRAAALSGDGSDPIVVATNGVFSLLRGSPSSRQEPATAEVLALAAPSDGALVEWLRAQGFVGVATGDERALATPDPPAVAVVASPRGRDYAALEAYVRAGGVLLISRAHQAPPPLGEATGEAVAADQPMRVGNVATWLPVPAATVTGEAFARAGPDGRPVIAVSSLGSGRVVRVGFDLGAAWVAQRQGRPALDADRDGNGSIQPADWMRGLGGPDLRARPHVDEASDALIALLVELARRPVARVWPLPQRHASLIVMTADQDFADDRLVRAQFAALRRQGATATLMATWPIGGKPDLNVRPDGSAPTLSPALASELLRAGHGIGMHPNLWGLADVARAAPNVLRGHARALTDAFGLAPRVARNHHLVWYGWDAAARDLAAAGVRMSFDYLAVDEPLGFEGGSGRPARFIAGGDQPLDIFQQPTQLDDFPLRSGETEAAKARLAARAQQLLRAACAAGSPLTLNTHPAYYVTSPRWVDALLARGVPAWDADRWLAFSIARRRSVLHARSGDPDGVTLDMEVASNASIALPATWRGRVFTSASLDGKPVAAEAPSCGPDLPAPRGVRLIVVGKPGPHQLRAVYAGGDHALPEQHQR